MVLQSSLEKHQLFFMCNLLIFFLLQVFKVGAKKWTSNRNQNAVFFFFFFAYLCCFLYSVWLIWHSTSEAAITSLHFDWPTIFCQSGIEWANAFCCNQSFSLLIIFVPNWHEQVYGLSISWKLQTISFPVVRFFGALPMAYVTAKKMKFSINDFFSKCTQIRSFLRVRSHLLEKSSIQNFNFCEVQLRN